MPKKGWLLDEFIKDRLEIVLRLRRCVSLKDFKVMFSIPVEDNRILQLAQECGFKVLKVRNSFLIEARGEDR